LVVAKSVGRLVENRVFQSLILAVIVLNAIIIGAGTYPNVIARYGSTLDLVDDLFLWIFVVEIALRIFAHGRRPREFFRSGWNVFDFAIIVFALLPLVLGTGVTVLRLLRIVRAFRLVSAFKDLRTIVAGMVHSILPLAGVGLLMVLLTYVYAVVGTILFGSVAPDDWEQVGSAALSVFRILTLENWDELYFSVAEVGPLATLYFVSFIIVATLVVLNLVIAVFVSSVERARETELAEESSQLTREVGERLPELTDRISELRRALDQLEQELRQSHHEEHGGAAPATEKSSAGFEGHDAS
jgi:voltage-gated sodium channel